MFATLRNKRHLIAYLRYDPSIHGLLRGLYKKFTQIRVMPKVSSPRSFYLMLAYMGINIRHADLVFYSGKHKAVARWRKGKVEKG